MIRRKQPDQARRHGGIGGRIQLSTEYFLQFARVFMKKS